MNIEIFSQYKIILNHKIELIYFNTMKSYSRGSWIIRHVVFLLRCIHSFFARRRKLRTFETVVLILLCILNFFTLFTVSFTSVLVVYLFN